MKNYWRMMCWRMIKTMSDAEFMQNNAAQNRLMNNEHESKMIY